MTTAYPEVETFRLFCPRCYQPVLEPKGGALWTREVLRRHLQKNKTTMKDCPHCQERFYLPASADLR